jgi:alpha-galactosidase
MPSVYRITATTAITRCTTAAGASGGWLLLAFASCHRFGGEFRLYPDGRLEIVMNAEGRTAPGQHWQSEALICLEGPDREALLGRWRSISRPNGTLLVEVAARPSGWCSWYHYYADVSAADIRENLAVRAERFPGPALRADRRRLSGQDGDWLTPSAKFEQGVAALAGERSAPPAASPRSGSPPLSPSPARRCFSSTLTGS